MDELNEQQRIRLDKARRLREAGIDPYPARSFRSHTAAQVVEQLGELEGREVTVAGRVLERRDMGKTIFADLEDGSGKIQLLCRPQTLGEAGMTFFKESLDRGDFVQVKGAPLRTRRGEPSIEARAVTLLAKSLNVLPDRHFGVEDVETRYRQRHVDLLANPEVRETFLKRARIITAMRRYLDERGYVEVETPVLQPIYGGAAARPFTTHHNTLDQTFYLRIATELYLKRLLVGGIERVYEIGKDFRNEGISTKHNPEFTMLELYQSYADYQDVMRLVEEMVCAIAEQVNGVTTATFRGHEIDLSPPWRRLPLREAIREATGVDYAAFRDAESLAASVRAAGIEARPGATRAELIDELLDNTEPTLIQPTFLIDYPLELSPFAKRKPDAPELTERFECFIGGIEIGNAFSELNDPVDQRDRFLEQVAERDAGNEETSQYDEDFIDALMYGMPPTGGLGIGIDRLAMVLTDSPSIRDVVLFPHNRLKVDPRQRERRIGSQLLMTGRMEIVSVDPKSGNILLEIDRLPPQLTNTKLNAARETTKARITRLFSSLGVQASIPDREVTEVELATIRRLESIVAGDDIVLEENEIDLPLPVSTAQNILEAYAGGKVNAFLLRTQQDEFEELFGVQINLGIAQVYCGKMVLRNEDKLRLALETGSDPDEPIHALLAALPDRRITVQFSKWSKSDS